MNIGAMAYTGNPQKWLPGKYLVINLNNLFGFSKLVPDAVEYSRLIRDLG
jgi:hypothetical protein